MALCGREKQRNREVFQAFSPTQKGQVENFIFVNPFDSTGFTGKKKADHLVGVIFLVAGAGIEPTAFRLWACFFELRFECFLVAVLLLTYFFLEKHSSAGGKNQDYKKRKYAQQNRRNDYADAYFEDQVQ